MITFTPDEIKDNIARLRLSKKTTEIISNKKIYNSVKNHHKKVA